MIHKEPYFNDFIKTLPESEKENLAEIFLNMDAVTHMLVYLFHENKNQKHFNKGNVYKNFFSSPYIQEYFDINGISVPTEEGAKHRLPFILNILEAFGLIEYSGRSDFEICKLPYVDFLFTTENFSATENINAVKLYYAEGILPPKEQLTELKLKFGTDFLTANYLIIP